MTPAAKGDSFSLPLCKGGRGDFINCHVDSGNISMVKPVSISIFFLLFMFIHLTSFGQNPSKENPVIILKDSKEIRISGYVQAKEFNREPFFSFGHTKNWHGIVWEGGKVKKSDVLFVSYADDLAVYTALTLLGAVPGNNLTMETWEERGEHNHPEPNKKVKGSPVDVKVSWRNSAKAYNFSELINDPGGKGISLKFGGHKDWISVWKSGCIVCLYSCPGGKISNAEYTANDYVSHKTHFTAREDILPPDGTEVVIILSVK